MKPPKNFYSNLDRRKQGLPELPEASVSDAGKVVKVGSDGDYELEADEGLPAVTVADNAKMIQVISGTWTSTPAMQPRNILVTGANGYVSSTAYMGIRLNEAENGNISAGLFNSSVNFTQLQTVASVPGILLAFTKKTGEIYHGITAESSATNVKGNVFDNDGNLYKLDASASSYTLTPTGSVKYYEITASGSSVSLPSGVTFADVYAKLQAGVDVKFTSGARVYSVTSFESTNIRAHWMSDLDLTSMEVYVINLASDGTGTVSSATFSGS